MRGFTILDLALGCCGPRRMIWGSDFPPVSGREGYRNALRLPMARLEEILSRRHADSAEEDLAAMFGGNAAVIYGLDGEGGNRGL